MLNCFFLWPSFILSIVLFKRLFPSALAIMHWRFFIDFLVGSAIVVGGVFNWLSRFGDGAEFSDVVDESSSSSLEDVFSRAYDVLLFLLSFSFVFDSVWKLIYRTGVLEFVRLPVLFPVGFVRLFVGLFCCPVVFCMRVNLFGRAVVVTSLSGAFGCSMSEKIGKVRISARICTRHNHLALRACKARMSNG